jgi:hypothetical protein
VVSRSMRGRVAVSARGTIVAFRGARRSIRFVSCPSRRVWQREDSTIWRPDAQSRARAGLAAASRRRLHGHRDDAPRPRIRRRASSGTSIARLRLPQLRLPAPSPETASPTCMNEPACVAFTYVNPACRARTLIAGSENASLRRCRRPAACRGREVYPGAAAFVRPAATAAAAELAKERRPRRPPAPPPPPPAPASSWQGTPTTQHRAAVTPPSPSSWQGRPTTPPPPPRVGRGAADRSGRAPTTAAFESARVAPGAVPRRCWGEPPSAARSPTYVRACRVGTPLRAQERGSARAANGLLSLGCEVARGERAWHSTRRRSNGRARRPTSGWANTRASTPGRSTAA